MAWPRWPIQGKAHRTRRQARGSRLCLAARRSCGTLGGSSPSRPLFSILRGHSCASWGKKEKGGGRVAPLQCLPLNNSADSAPAQMLLRAGKEGGSPAQDALLLLAVSFNGPGGIELSIGLGARVMPQRTPCSRRWDQLPRSCQPSSSPGAPTPTVGNSPPLA